MQRKITLKHHIEWLYNDEEVLEFEVKKDLIGDAQFIGKVRRINRLLPVGHRFRGDVCA